MSIVAAIIIKATTDLGHSSPKREQCNTAKQFVFGHDVISLYRLEKGKELYNT